ncbi:MAG TPA: amidohydrolase family protein [Bryobacteraceae bacterium]|nr:amidohydrolase family protein [Bryobacteraceae bacterium]
MSFLLIEGGEVKAAHSPGVQSILVAQSSIIRIGEIDPRSLDALGVEYARVDARDCQIWPGLIDVHEHLIGGSGEEGWGTQTPEITLGEIVGGGITTVVGCLGTDTVTRTMPALLARAKGLNRAGLSAWIWTGGYDVPPATLTGSVRNDVMFVEEVIGAGEIAIADHRSSAAPIHELARLIKSAHVGGMLSGKAGVTHFHVGEEDRRLGDLRALLDDWSIEPDWIYPTHVERSEELMREAVALSRRGVTVDVDVVEKDLARWLPFYLAEGGSPDHLTVSSDAAITSPGNLFHQIRDCILNHGVPADVAMSLVTSNPARVLQLNGKGKLEEGADADFVIVQNASLEIRHVIARGKLFVHDGSLVAQEGYLSSSDRQFVVQGEKR